MKIKLLGLGCLVYLLTSCSSLLVEQDKNNRKNSIDTTTFDMKIPVGSLLVMIQKQELLELKC